MADISYSVTVAVNKDNLTNNLSASSVTATMNNAGLKSVTYTLTTTAVSVSTANLTAVGLAFLRNLSTATAATAQFGIDAGGSFGSLCTLRAGEPAVFRLSAGTNYAAIGSSGARLRVDILEG